MGPGVYKTQSKHTKNKSCYRTGTILLRNASLCLNTEGKSDERGWSTGKLVAMQDQLLQIRQLAQFSRDGTWGIQNPVKTYKNQVTPSYWYDFTEERKPMPSYWRQVRGKKDGVPVSWLSDIFSSFKFANWPNSAGIGPWVYKTQSKYTKIKSRYRTGTISLGNSSLCLNIECKSGGRGMSTGKLVGA